MDLESADTIRGAIEQAAAAIASERQAILTGLAAERAAIVAEVEKLRGTLEKLVTLLTMGSLQWTLGPEK